MMIYIVFVTKNFAHGGIHIIIAPHMFVPTPGGRDPHVLKRS
jgi:hypothetical protein